MPDSDIQRLVERIEGATGPDRELDCRVWCAVGGNSVDHFEVACAVVPDLNQWMAPRYTASLDAAMTLVPSEFYMGRLHQWVADNFRWACDLARKDMTGGKRISAEDCATPALAIAAASLRARITERTDDE